MAKYTTKDVSELGTVFKQEAASRKINLKIGFISKMRAFVKTHIAEHYRNKLKKNEEKRDNLVEMIQSIDSTEENNALLAYNYGRLEKLNEKTHVLSQKVATKPYTILTFDKIGNYVRRRRSRIWGTRKTIYAKMKEKILNQLKNIEEKEMASEYESLRLKLEGNSYDVNYMNSTEYSNDKKRFEELKNYFDAKDITDMMVEEPKEEEVKVEIENTPEEVSAESQTLMQNDLAVSEEPVTDMVMEEPKEEEVKVEIENTPEEMSAELQTLMQNDLAVSEEPVTDMVMEEPKEEEVEVEIEKTPEEMSAELQALMQNDFAVSEEPVTDIVTEEPKEEQSSENMETDQKNENLVFADSLARMEAMKCIIRLNDPQKYEDLLSKSREWSNEELSDKYSEWVRDNYPAQSSDLVTLNVYSLLTNQPIEKVRENMNSVALTTNDGQDYMASLGVSSDMSDNTEKEVTR